MKKFDQLYEAAEKGNAEAQCSLGSLYYKGEEVNQDYSEAFKWFNQSAEQGNATAEYNLGIMYRDAIGVPKDMDAARKWFNLAIEHGSDSAKSNLHTLDTTQGKNKSFAFDSLESIRRRLLDLTGRNSLLNFRHPKSSCVRLIDELPDQIYEVLSEGGKFTFIPIPEPTEAQLIEAGYLNNSKAVLKDFPTAEQWAKYLGLNTAYELPEATDGAVEEKKHQDSNLQTLLYAPELEARLRHIKNAAESSIEESGSNILYLALGFMEWYESRDSDVIRSAPLFTLPVQLDRTDLDRNAGAYRYTLQLKDEGLLSNITLREKLSNDFGLVLPAIEEDVLPEAYFDEVRETALSNQPRWKIRRQASLVLLNFSKQAMYEDLNPLNWPEGANIQDHPLVKHFFTYQPDADGTDTSNLTYESEYLLDTMNEVHDQYPTIYDADSSQHSAVIDVVKGKNLVIEGPPGSGKSQTITNIIAASIANGKKVLFVAEKMAALNVVKDRLDRAGLGDFCLEIHSHKTNKQKILNDLEQRINNQISFTSPQQIEADIDRYEDLKSKLNHYALKINSPWGNTGFTIHQILNKATKLQQQYKLNPETLLIEDVSGDTLSHVKQRQLHDSAFMLDSVYQQVLDQTPDNNIQTHYWYGVNKSMLNGSEAELVIEALKQWSEQLEVLYKEWSKLSEKASLLSEIESLIKSAKLLPDLIGDEDLDNLGFYYSHHDEIHAWHDEYQKIHTTIRSIKADIKPELIFNKLAFQKVSDLLTHLNSQGIPYSRTLRMLNEDTAIADNLYKVTLEVKIKLEAFKQHLPDEFSGALKVSVNAINELAKVVALIEKLPAELWKLRSAIYDDSDMDAGLKAIDAPFAKLTELHTQLKDDFVLDRLPSLTVMSEYKSILDSGGLFKWLSPKWRQARAEVLRLSKKSLSDKGKFLSQVHHLISYLETIESLNKLTYEHPVLKDLYRGVDTPIAQIIEIRNWYKAIREEYGVGFNDRVKMGDAILNLNKDMAASLLSEYKKDLLPTIQRMDTGLTHFKQYYPNHQINKDLDSDFSSPNSTLNNLLKDLTALSSGLNDVFINQSLSLNNVYDYLPKLKALHSEAVSWNQSSLNQSIAISGNKLSLDPNYYSSITAKVIMNTLTIAKVMEQSSYLKGLFVSDKTPAHYKEVANQASMLSSIYDLASQAKVNFANLADVDLQQWLKGKDDIAEVLIKNNLAVTNPTWLSTWVEYLGLKSKLYDQGLRNIVDALEKALLERHDLQDIVDLAITYQLSKDIFAKNPDLVSFSGLEQNAIQQRFKEYDQRIMALQRKKIAYRASRVNPPTGIGSGKVSSYTDTALIKHEISKKSRHIAVRSLLRRAGGSIQTLKPCFMMSPMSVAQYLEPGRFNFDLIVMDEASQIRPEDALGAIARGSKLVVVGDPKQLPPTSFFNKVLEEDPEEEIVGLQDSESILEAVMPMFNTRRLRWHYRSKHESLIAFSNKHFYDSDLVLFPSPFKASEEFGVKLHKIPKGRFSSSRNVEEAQEVVKWAAKHLIENPSESLGIVAMNSQQREEIEKQLDQIAKDNPALLQAVNNNKSKPDSLFIKNLENVQGDERDVIYISMTYGPEKLGGPVMQRFGPINTETGWRRLNVLFTRSKKRMHIFSSMMSGNITNGGSRGVQALKAFLEFAETGHLHNTIHTGKAPDSDFELAVMSLLSKHGYECEPQLGVAGFFLDLAVKDPGMSGRFLMGIECDGATYHSAKSARDRDHLRQEILESLGWKIRRIWSTDWFKNPEAQILPIINELNNFRTVGNEQANFEAEIKTDFSSIPAETEIIFEVSALGSKDEGEISPEIFEEETLTVKDRLLRFNEQVIKDEFPKTDESKRLLRQEMLDALLEHLPTSKAEFQEFIPSYLRTGTITYEAKFLDEVLSIIADYA